MFKFKSLELMNWDCYPHYKAPLDGEIILLVGQNGSGKTTFLDALRVLLNSSSLSKQRTLHHYIQKDVEVAMIRAVVTNDLVGEKRPFTHMGIHGDTNVSLICLIKNKGAKRLEKEFHIIKGEPSAEEIYQLKGGLKPLQYSRYLQEAGVSRSTLRLIALEQGQTDRIGQLSPTELLQLVMDITGNKDIIKRYEEAKENYRHTLQQLIELKTEYNKIVMQTKELEEEARQAETYRDLLQEKEKIEKEKLPLSRWYEVLNQLHDLEKNFQNYQEYKLSFEKRLKTIRDQQLQIKEEQQKLQSEQQQLKQLQQEQERELNQLHQKIGQSHTEWKQLDDLKRACQDLKTEEASREELQAQLEEHQEVYYQAKTEISHLDKEIQKAQAEKISLKNKGLPTYPDEVYSFRDILAQNSIDNLLFAEGIEITDPYWQLAIEAHLGRERFTVFVDSKDFLRAKKLGEEYRYGFYISPAEKKTVPSNIPKNSILANIKVLDERISARVIPLKNILLVESVSDGHKYQNDITITKKGYRQDRRGGIFIGRRVRFYCGGMAAEQQVEELNEVIQEKENLIRELKREAEQENYAIGQLRDKLAVFKKKERWENSKERYHEVEEEGKALMKLSEQKAAQRKATEEEQDLLTKKLNQNLAQYQQLEKEYKKIEQERADSSQEYHTLEKQILHLRWRKNELEQQIPEHSRAGYVPENFEEVKWLEKKVRDLQEQIVNYPGCRELEKISLFQHESQELQKKKTQLSRQERDQQQREHELEKCRRDYREMIEQTVHFYNKSLKELASLAGCRMRAFLELGPEDSLIENARLQVRVAFDQKREVDIRDKSLSGGQDVIASLILLVGLSRMEQKQASGFFILDEHNAHLDMMRIMEVGHFLRSTKAQFVLTTPTTENMATLAVSDLILTFTKKSHKQHFAEKPRFVRRA